MYKHWLVLLGLTISIGAKAGTKINPDKIYDSNIKTVLIHPLGNSQGLPVISLDQMNALEISFDDLKAQQKNYYYSVELMNEDWTSANLSPFDYLQGFNQNRITNFSISSIAIQSYYHYKFTFPNSNCRPTQSGNYIMKVYKDANPNQLIFTQRFYVTENQVSIMSFIQEPFDGNLSKTHQKVQLSIDAKKLSYFLPDQLKVQVIQNYRYNDGLSAAVPSFIRGTILEYNSEQNLIFPSGKEVRWLDLQSLRLRSDRVSKFESTSTGTIVYVKPDVPRVATPYFRFKDLNGNFLIANSESLESDDQNDYATVVFTYIPPNQVPLIGQHLYLNGTLTNNKLDASSEMSFNPKLGMYQKSLLLKQGYYSYSYILRDNIDPDPLQDFNETEGDHWETENAYSIFVYYRPPGARHDHLIGFSTVHSNQF
ncbi:MAG: DUF5103 domain-containing protein [Bacteroidetes bacterium]|nr:DUF5103 domain-containing protein [Bacteroidota bacterium]